MIKMELSGKAVAICNPSPKAISIYNVMHIVRRNA